MTDEWWFWLIVGVGVCRVWETECAKPCLGPDPYGKVFGVSNLTNSVFELSGAACLRGGAPVAAPAGSAPSGACCRGCESGGDGSVMYKPPVTITTTAGVA